MIIECPHCDGKMRVDETKIPFGARARVRCPHCNEISPANGGTPSHQTGRIARSTAAPGQSMASTSAGSPQAAKARSEPGASEAELCFPKDAFQNFRFPAETEIPAASNKKAGSMKRLAVWVLVSLAVIGLFALLVNLVLPGPYGTKPFGQADKMEQGSPKAPVVDGRQNPGAVR